MDGDTFQHNTTRLSLKQRTASSPSHFNLTSTHTSAYRTVALLVDHSQSTVNFEKLFLQQFTSPTRFRFHAIKTQSIANDFTVYIHLKHNQRTVLTSSLSGNFDHRHVPYLDSTARLVMKLSV